MRIKRAFFPGTFDPPTLGHLDIIRRAAEIFEHLIVGIGENFSKRHMSLFTPSERVDLLNEILREEIKKPIEVSIVQGLGCEFAKKNQIDVIVRGLRTVGDSQYEIDLAQTNMKLCEIETLLIPVNPEYAYIQSTLVREAGANGAPLDKFLPQSIIHKVAKKFKGNLS